MKVVVLGGYGVFGSRVAELILRDGHSVWLAGRDPEKARALAAEVGGQPLALDIRATPEKIFEPAPDIVIDATGPFQSNENNTYTIPALCLDRGVDYFDLSDDAEFTAGISILDQKARNRDCHLISGASSVPGLSSIVAAELGSDFDEILLIDTVIIPGNRAPRGIGVLRRIWPFELRPTRVRFIQWCANLFLPFGTDRGGMRVAVIGRKGGEFRQREWRLIAEAGHGPYIPAVVVRTLLRQLKQLPPGARACLAELTREQIEEAMSDLSVRTEIIESDRSPLFQSALGDNWSELPPCLQDFHSVQDIESFSGRARVERGKSLTARLIIWLFRFPVGGNEIPLTVKVIRTSGGETWERSFAGHILRSFCAPAISSQCYQERFGLFNFELNLVVENNSMSMTVRRGWFLGLPIPEFLLPRSNSREYAEEGLFHFDITLSAPLGTGLIVRYCGHLTPDRLPAS